MVERLEGKVNDSFNLYFKPKLCEMDYNIFHFFFRQDITFKEVSGESEKFTKEMAAPWEVQPS